MRCRTSWCRDQRLGGYSLLSVVFGWEMHVQAVVCGLMLAPDILQDIANDDSRDAGSPNPTAWVARRTIVSVDRFPTT